jgi:glycosyltransferase involved in cell wall biosynthesis
VGLAPARVSVIVPTRNRSALLRQALESILALRGPDLQLEIIVADNGSTDDTREVAASLGARVVHAEARGAAAARNEGLRAATGDYLAFLDDDDLWTREHLRPHLALLAERPELDAVVGQAVNSDESGASRAEPWPRSAPADGDLLASFLDWYPQIGGTVARARVREKVAWFDPALVGDQDWDFHLRLALHYQVGFVAVPCVIFRHRAAGEDADLIWRRMAYSRRVFWRNVARAGSRRPPLLRVLRTFVRQRGTFCGQLVLAARARAAGRDPASARRAALRAFAASPLHAFLYLLRDGNFRRSLLGARP